MGHVETLSWIAYLQTTVLTLQGHSYVQTTLVFKTQLYVLEENHVGMVNLFAKMDSADKLVGKLVLLRLLCFASKMSTNAQMENV